MKRFSFRNLRPVWIAIPLLFVLLLFLQKLLIVLRFTNMDSESRVINIVTGSKSDIGLVQMLDQRDVRVADYIRTHHLYPPSTLPYALANSLLRGAVHPLDILFNHKKNGTFLEVGAYNGETFSISLYFEQIGWTGILIECNPFLTAKLKAKNRKTWNANCCLSTRTTPENVNLLTLEEWPASAQLNKPMTREEMTYWQLNWVKDKTWYNYSLPGFPLYSIIKATGAFTELDLLILDVQGVEDAVLRNFPFDLFTMKVIFVEMVLFQEAKQKQIGEMMERRGFYILKHGKNDQDWIFVHNTFKTKENLKALKLM